MFYVVDLPWGYKAPGVRYFAKDKIWVYEGNKLPANLVEFRAPAFSRGRWLEDQLNGRVTPVIPGEVSFIPKPHQVDAAKKIALSYDAGWGGFILADRTGIGKTLSGLAGVALVAKRRGFTNAKKAQVLIVCPKSVIPQWRQTIRNYIGAHKHLRFLILNYQQLQKLLSTPESTKTAKRTKTKRRQTARDGAPLIDFNFVIFDEAHKLKNYPSSNTSLAAVRVAQLDKVYKKDSSPFVIFSTATPGSTPLNLAVMSGILGRLLKPNAPRHITPNQWGDFLIANGFHVKKGKSGYSWVSLPWGIKESKDPKELAAYKKALTATQTKQRADTQRIGKALTQKNAPFIMRSPKNIAGWPEQQIVPMPVEMTPEQTSLYAEAWTRFRNWLRLTPAKADPKGALVETLRYRQKTSLLRIDAIADFALDMIENDKQIYISCEFIDTVEKLKETFLKNKIPVSEISGRTSDQKEYERIAFQKGQTKVVLSTVVEGISLHAGEILPDGSKATSNDRITILADIRQNPLDALQTLGRAHRDGVNSIAYIPYLENTVDERIVNSFVNKVVNTEVMTGKKLEEALNLETIFREAAEKN